MRAAIPRFVLGVLALCAGVLLFHDGTNPANAIPVSAVSVAAVTCQPFNKLDGGTGIALGCGTGYVAVKLQNNTTTPVYVGGGSSFTPANYTYGQKHCSGCADGPGFAMDAYQGKLYCISGTADAGAVVSVICGR